MPRALLPGDDVVEIDVHLHDVHPPVWRRIQMPAAASLADLHRVLQRAMGWTDSHLHQFDVDGNLYGVPDPDRGEVADETGATLGTFARPGARFEYAYDFGDGWIHSLTVRQVLSAEAGVRYPRCLDGGRACPPEDVGGPWGYGTFLAAVADPRHEEHQTYARWSGPFDPERFDLLAVERGLAPLAWREPSGSVPAAACSDPTPGMVLRCTGKLLKVLKPPKNSLVETPPSPEDWYANVLYVQGRKCLLATHAGTLFSIFLPDVRAAGLRPIGGLLVPAVEAALLAEDLPADGLGALDPAAVRLAKTADRGVLGAMNHLAEYCDWVVAHHGGLARLELSELHRLLHRNPLGSRNYAYAVDLVRARLGLEPTPPEWI
ncbi:MAG: plasmid pRiA4b ORF-3 family protein [Sporichthyaceae bacterium]